jgi:hypothetical protein
VVVEVEVEVLQQVVEEVGLVVIKAEQHHFLLEQFIQLQLEEEVLVVLVVVMHQIMVLLEHLAQTHLFQELD